MKKIMLLGGSSQQVIAIHKAKELGYYTILCDYLPDNPGRAAADRYYQASTTNVNTIMRIAEQEGIDGIVAYSSDPAAPTAAYVAERLHLPGIPYKIANTFCNKHLFRAFLKDNGFNVPKSVTLTANSTIRDVEALSFPMMIKPTDSSGSKGVNVVDDPSCFENALKAACEISRNGIIIAEEFIRRDHPGIIEAEIMVMDGEVRIWGLMSTLRDPFANPLLPAAYAYPINIPERRIHLVKQEIRRLVACTGVSYGAFNIEMVISSREQLFFLDAGPRNGGNELPEFIGDIAGADLVDATIRMSMGDYAGLEDLKLRGDENGFWGMYVLHAHKEGTFVRVEYDTTARNALIRESFFKHTGDKVGPFETSRDAIGLAFFRFKDQQNRDEILNDFGDQHIRIVVSGK